jgi:hypothetical protein
MRLPTPEKDREAAVDNSLAVGAHLRQILHVSFLSFLFYLIFCDQHGIHAGLLESITVDFAMQRA